MNKVKIDTAISAIVDITGIGHKELVHIYFTAEENWLGTFQVKLYNSDKKNREIPVTASPAPLSVVDKVMTLTINPDNQGLSPVTYYYEISSIDTERILFKGNLIINI